MTTMTKLELSDVHGRITTTIDTTHPVCVVGPNRAGKSTVLRAALMILTGDTSPLGRPPTVAMMDAAFDVDGARTLHGMVVPSVGAVEHLIKRRPVGTKAALAERKALLGAAGAWSVDEFLALSATKRTAWLAQNIQSSAWDADEVFAEVQVVLDGVADPRLDTSLALDVREAEGRRLTACGREVAARHLSSAQLAGQDGGKVLDELIAAVGAAAKAAQADKLALEKAVQQDEADQRARASRLPPGTVAQWQNAIDKATADIAGLQAQLRDADAASQRVRRRAARQQAVGEQLRVTVEALNALRATPVGDTATWEAELERVKQLADAAEVAVTTAATRWTNASDARSVLVNEHIAAQHRLAELEAARNAAGAYEGLVRATQDWFALLSDVRVDADTMIEVLDTEANHDVPRARITTTVKALWSAIGTAPAVPTEKAISSARAALDEVRQRGTAAAAQLDSAQRLRDNAVASRAAATQKMSEVKSRLDALGSVRAEHERRERELEERRTSLEAERQVLDEETAAEVAMGNVDDMRALLEDRQRALRDATANRDRLNDNVQALETLARRRSLLTTRETEAQSLRALLSACNTARANLMARDADPIAEVAGSVVRDVLGAELSVSDGDVWVTTDRATYSVDTASDGERVVVLMAFALAVRSRLPGWRPAIVDRLDALEPDLRAKFAQKLLDLHRERMVDNVIIALHGDASAAPAGYAVVTLEGP